LVLVVGPQVPAAQGQWSCGGRSGGQEVTAVHDCSIPRSEEHTSELQSLTHIVCRLLLLKKKKTHNLGRHSRASQQQRVTEQHTRLLSLAYSLSQIHVHSAPLLLFFF